LCAAISWLARGIFFLPSHAHYRSITPNVENRLIRNIVYKECPMSATVHTSPTSLSRDRSPLRRFRAAIAMTVVLATGLGIATPSDAARRRVKTRTDFSLLVSPDAATVVTGSNTGTVASFPVTVQATRGYYPQIRWEIDGVPDAIDAQVQKVGLNRYRLDLTVPANIGPSNGVYQLFATSGSRERSALFRLTVTGGVTPTAPPVTAPPVTVPPVTVPAVTTPPTVPVVAPSFGLRLDNPDLSASTNGTAIYGITVDRSSGYSGTVAFSLSGLPSGATANFAPNPTTTNTNLYITPGASTPSGRYVLTVTASAGSTVRTGAIALTVTAVADFQLVPNTPSLTINAPGKATVNVAIRRLGSVTPTIALSLNTIPSGVTAAFTATTTNKDFSLTFAASTATPAGIYNLVVTGRSGNFTQQFPIQVIVNNPSGFKLEASPSDLGIARGTGATTFVKVTPFGGFNGPVSLTVSALPAGVTLRPGQITSVTGTVPLIFDVAASALPTASGQPIPVTITGTSGVLTGAIKVNIAIV
jgi:hypothetical protein